MVGGSDSNELREDLSAEESKDSGLMFTYENHRPKMAGVTAPWEEVKSESEPLQQSISDKLKAAALARASRGSARQP